MGEIKNHRWFLKNLPRELTEAAQGIYFQRNDRAPTYSLQSVEEIMRIVEEARRPASRISQGVGWTAEEEDEEEEGMEDEEDGYHTSEELPII